VFPFGRDEDLSNDFVVIGGFYESYEKLKIQKQVLGISRVHYGKGTKIMERRWSKRLL